MTHLDPAGDFPHVTAPCRGFQLFGLARATQFQFSEASSTLHTAPSSVAQDENDFFLSPLKVHCVRSRRPFV